MCKIMVHFSSINCWFTATFVYLPNFFLKARVLFLNFLCLCLFIFKRRFRSTLVNSSSSTTLLLVGWDTDGCGGAGTEKGRRRETCSETLATDIVFLAILTMWVHVWKGIWYRCVYLQLCKRALSNKGMVLMDVLMVVAEVVEANLCCVACKTFVWTLLRAVVNKRPSNSFASILNV